MKKIIAMVVSIIIATSSTVGMASEWSANDAINNLQVLDILRTSSDAWDSSSTITRRMAFQMAYMVKRSPEWMMDYRENNRQYMDIVESGSDETDEEAYQFWVECYQPQLVFSMDFKDLGAHEDDYKLAISLLDEGLLSGRMENGEVHAAFDEEMTYNEALALIVRMLQPAWPNFAFGHVYIAEEYNDYLEITRLYKLTCDDVLSEYIDGLDDYGMGYISNEDARVIFVSEDMLDKPIPAYSFFKLFYNSLFVEVQFNIDNLENTGKWIDILLKNMGEEKKGREDILI